MGGVALGGVALGGTTIGWVGKLLGGVGSAGGVTRDGCGELFGCGELLGGNGVLGGARGAVGTDAGLGDGGRDVISLCAERAEGGRAKAESAEAEWAEPVVSAVGWASGAAAMTLTVRTATDLAASTSAGAGTEGGKLTG